MANLPVLTACQDNASGQLSAGIASNTTSIPLQSGQGALFAQPQNGTCTSAGSASTLNSTGIGALISVGQAIRNVTDGSWAFVLTTSTNSCTTTALQGGAANTWANTNVWRVNEMVITLEHRDGSGNVLTREKALISGRTTDTLTCASASDRGFDGSTATSFLSNDYVVLDVASYTIRKIIEQLSELARLTDKDITNITNLQNGSYYFVTTTGSANAYVAATPALTALAAGNIVIFKANFTNTGSATLNLNGLGAQTIKKLDGATNLGSGDITNGQVVIAVYDGTSFQMLTPSSTVTTNQAYVKNVYASGADSTILTNPTAGTPYTLFDTHNYTIPANDLTATVGYEFELAIDYTFGASTTSSLALRLGSTVLAICNINVGASGAFCAKGFIMGTAAAGASVAVRSEMTLISGTQAAGKSVSSYVSANVTTNGTLVLQWAFLYDTSNASNAVTMRMCRINKFSTSLFT